MSASNLISHRMFVSALAQEPRPRLLDNDKDIEPGLGDSSIAVHLEVLCESDVASGWRETQTDFQFDYSP